MMQDVRYAFRWLRRSPGFAAVAILSLGLGVGVNTAMFSLVDTLLFKPLPVRAPGSLVDVFTSSADGDEYATSSCPDFADVQAQNTVFEDMTAYSPIFAPLALGERSRLVHGPDRHGQPFHDAWRPAAAGPPAAPRPMMRRRADVSWCISHRMWQSRVRRIDRGALGQTLTLRGLPYTIIGVARPDFRGVVPLLTPELWVPMAQAEEVEPVGITSVCRGPGRTRARAPRHALDVRQGAA